MAATKVMKFWAVCLAFLGKLLASLGVSAPAAAARREAALHEATPRPAIPFTPAQRGPDTPRDPGPGNAGVPAKPATPLCGQGSSMVRMLSHPQLPPTIKQRIRAEAHGASPTSRTRLAKGIEPLSTLSAEAALHTGAQAVPVAIPAPRRREHTPCAL
ncbi:DUF6344 domain-containing protein [Streptomyces sp. NPDC017993]|uniref:DUF6344 domain-containing protein n=1 Tax=Streptomyces sp. NPDC017993 TaxID=3365027 RepID=UPI0037B0EAD3